VLDNRGRAGVVPFDGVAPAGDAELVTGDLDRSYAARAGSGRVVACGVGLDADFHLVCVGLLAHGLKPGPAGAEDVVSDQADR